MPRKLIILILISLTLSLAFPQGYNMQVVGSWRCPTGDLSDPWVGGIEILGDYVIMARFDWRWEGSDTLWIIDVSDKKNPTLAATYVETTFCYRPARIASFTVLEDSNLIAVTYYCPSPSDTSIFRVLQLRKVSEDSPVVIVPRGYLKCPGRISGHISNALGDYIIPSKFYVYSSDSVLDRLSFYRTAYDSRGISGDISMYFMFFDYTSSDSFNFVGGCALPSSSSYEPAPALKAYKLRLHAPSSMLDTFEVLGFWRGDWDGSEVTAIGYSDSMNLLAALTDHYLVLLQPSTNPSDLGRRYFREIGRYRRWWRDADGYAKLIFDRNYLILCGGDTVLSSGEGITVLRFDTTLSFDVVGYISGMAYDFIAKRGRYLYAYNWNGLDIIECLFDTSNVWEGGYNDGDGEDIDIYPNPVYYGSKVNISSRHSITIYDIRGNVAAKISGGNKAVKLNLAPGVYFAVSSNGRKKAITKFVVIK